MTEDAQATPEAVADPDAEGALVDAQAADETPFDDRPIDARISAAFESLTGNERRLAEVVLDAGGNLAGFTAAELAGRASVSTATASRFFQRLGYRTYNDARRLSRDQQAWGSPLYEMAGLARTPSVDDGFTRHITQDIQNLARTAELIAPAALARAVDMLAGARTVWIAGFRNSATLAAYARGLLANAKPDARLLPVAGMTLAEDLAGMGPQDCLLAIGFRRRPTLLRDILAVAADAGTGSILLTDMSAMRTAQLASLVLRCHNAGDLMFDSYAAAISVVNYLCAAVATAVGEPAIARLARIEQLHRRLGQTATPVLPPDGAAV